MKEKTYPVISTNPADLDVPGVEVEFTADEAERWGAFEETAMSEEDARESNADLVLTEPDGEDKNRRPMGRDEELPYFIPDDGSPSDVPQIIDRTTGYSSARPRPGESIREAIIRRQNERAAGEKKEGK